MLPHRLIATAGLLAALLLAACAAPGEEAGRVERFRAELSGAQEVPAVMGAGRGRAEADYHLRSSMLRWRISYSDLSGPVTAAHIHGPAGPGQNAPPLVPLQPARTITGQLRLTPEQYTQLQSGQWYVNLHTTAHPQGEVRGQLRHHPD